MENRKRGRALQPISSGPGLQQCRIWAVLLGSGGFGCCCPAGQEAETHAECPGRRGPRCGWKLKFKLLFLSFCDGTRAVLGSTRQQRRWLCWYRRLGGTSAVLLNSKSAAMFAIHVQSGGFPASAVVFISKITFGTIGSATFTASF